MDADSIRDLFAAFGPVRLKRMFGGKGVYSGETIFAIEASGELWLKVDDDTRPRFEAAGSAPFTFQKKTGQVALTSYWRLPKSAIDDPETVAEWARLALAAARRAQAAKVAGKPKPGEKKPLPTGSRSGKPD